MRRWLKEPLLHFCALGLVVVAVYRWVAPQPPTNQIVLSEAAIEGLRQDYLRRNGALPTAAEQAALIQRFVDDEVLYREALALGLDRGDVIVRRRLVQKMEFVLEGSAAIPEPSDEELQGYLDAHAERYALPERLTLTHVFVSADRHGEQAQPVAERLHGLLLGGEDPADLGDPFLRGREFPLKTERELAAIFGAPFAAQAKSLPLGTWSEPLRSSFGLHLVRVTARTAGRQPTLAEVRATLRRDWQDERRTQMSQAELARVRQRYEIHVAAVPPVAPAVAEVATSR